jgi:SAM-dependent methyltransferase
MKCPVCFSSTTEVLLKQDAPSVTSVSTILNIGLSLYFCSSCQHAFKQPLENTEKFYSEDYKFNLESENFDQYYPSDTASYRAIQQALLAERYYTKDIQNVLDYGAGKGEVLQYLSAHNPHIHPYLFELDSDYKKYWQWAPGPNQFIKEIPPKLFKKMDLILSFGVIGHVEDLHSYLKNCAQLLRLGGKIFVTTPNMYANCGTAVIRDIIQNYSLSSLTHLLEMYNFQIMKISTEDYSDHFFVEAKLSEKILAPIKKLFPPDTAAECKKIANFWNEFPKKLLSIENKLSSNCTIYGAGFYGSYIFSKMIDKTKISFFCDVNEKMKNLKKFNLPIKHPLDGHKKTHDIILALNPNKIDFFKKTIPYLEKSVVHAIEL